MDNKLKDLDKVMDEAVYQRKRFSEEQKQEILKKINDHKHSRLKEFTNKRGHQALSFIAIVILFFSIFTNVYRDPTTTQLDTDKLLNQEKASLSNYSPPIASLAMLKRIEELLIREKVILDAQYVKVDKHINLTIIVSNELNEEEIKLAAEHFLQRGSNIYDNLPSAEKFQGVLDVWDPYSMTIFMKTLPIWHVNYRANQHYFYADYDTVLEGIKQKKQAEIVWAPKPDTEN
jgi:hypothetical protein